MVHIKPINQRPLSSTTYKIAQAARKHTEIIGKYY